MPDSALILPFPTHDLIERHGGHGEEEGDDSAAPGRSCLSVPIQFFHVRSLEHWIDLCA
jgi:hypothetical protein